MKNLSTLAMKALRLRPSMRKHTDVAKALSRFHPVGFSACGMSKKNSEAFCQWAGDAKIGETRVTRDTIFRVASISKVFGAAAALLLVRQGKLGLDTPASEVLGFDTVRPVTLRQLITHTAALNDVPAYDDAIFMPQTPHMKDVLEKSFFSHELGTKFHYSNFGAGIVGMMVEAASGMIFDDFIRSSFFLPHDIDASFHPQRIIKKEKMANCYRVPGRVLEYDASAIAALPMDEAPNPARHYAFPAGKLMIAAPDLAACISRLPDMLPEMFVLQNGIGSVKGESGRGLGVAFAQDGVFATGREMWGHQGNAYGALCEAWIGLSDRTVAVVLTNGVKLTAIGSLCLAGQNGIAALLDHMAESGVY